VRVAVYPADLGGCGHHRMIWPARTLQAQGADVRLVMPADHDQIQSWWMDGDDGPKVLDVMVPDADVVVIQRPLQNTLVAAIPIMQAKGVKVVVEIDDDFEAIHPQNIAWHTVHPKFSPSRNWHHLLHACQLADLVTVTTPALAARYGRHGRVAVVPNMIPERYLDITREPHFDVWCGWSGSVETHPTDLQAARGGIATAVRDAGARFAVIGTGRGVQRALGLAEAPHAAGWRAIDEYPEALAQLDVGVVPLDLIPFNAAKSWLKGLEMAAVGVPFVASPTAPYVELEAAGAGIVANRSKDWARELRHLLTSADARAHFAGQGRSCAKRMTIEGNCEQWWDAWCSSVNAMSAV